ncbi:MAG: rhodanese-like domain-containing protein [Bacteroidetes bacterium]|nr:rhodanese-like domain-containing protein [Bacteroidota bacterium]MBS1671362.1 rhodanese-like domain-containing protein [Bacteroidota bacterium]
MKNNKTVIDVRTPAEFAGGSVVGSINIPLNEIEIHAAEIKQMQQPIVLCCASGMRSGQATAYLKNIGVDCENGGSWIDVNYTINNN